MRERKSKYIKEGPYGVVDPRRVGGGEGMVPKGLEGLTVTILLLTLSPSVGAPSADYRPGMFLFGQPDAEQKNEALFSFLASTGPESAA